MGREVHNNRMNSVGHGGDVRDNAGMGSHLQNANFADIGFANAQFWTIDFFHIATKKCVNFRAFVTEFSDSFSSNWESESVYGRMDDLKIFKGTTRKISFGWAVPSVDEVEARKNLHKFEHLSALLYPTYERRDAATTMAGSPLLKIKFGNLIQDSTKNSRSPEARVSGLTGHVSGFSMNPDVDVGFFTPSPGLFLPKVFKVSCEFDVIHPHALGWDQGSSWLTHPADKFPYGLHEQTGDHSICRDRGRRPTSKAGSKAQGSSKATKAKEAAAAGMCLDGMSYPVG